jgi:cytoskeletal protein CcmA (bactofilin family)
MTNTEQNEAILSQGTVVRGRITGEGDLRVLGTVEGDISLRGSLLVGEGGRVLAGTVEASHVSVEGEIGGEIVVSGELVVHAAGVVRGRLRGASIRIHEGATVAADIESDFELPEALR